MKIVKMKQNERIFKMTGKEIKKAETLISNEAICKKAKDICDKIGFEPKKAYPSTDASPIMKSDIRQYMHIGKTVKLFRRGFYLGATNEELTKIAMHMMVLVEAKEFSLDYKKSEIDNDIAMLSQKYDVNTFLSTPFSVIERRSKAYANY